MNICIQVFAWALIPLPIEYIYLCSTKPTLNSSCLPNPTAYVIVLVIPLSI